MRHAMEDMDMATPSVTTAPTFERISSSLGNPGSPFDKNLSLRDREVVEWVGKINKFSPMVTLIPEVEALYEAVYPGQGGFGPGGGPRT